MSSETSISSKKLFRLIGTADAPILMEVLSMKRRGSDGRAQVEPGNRSRGAKKQEAQVCFGPEGNADLDRRQKACREKGG